MQNSEKTKRRIYEHYADYVVKDPFHERDQVIKAARFDAAVEAAVRREHASAVAAALAQAQAAAAAQQQQQQQQAATAAAPRLPPTPPPPRLPPTPPPPRPSRACRCAAAGPPLAAAAWPLRRAPFRA
jgi:hypothetical protein